MNTIKGAIHSIETFGSVDGPGVRYVIFLQGCHMRCKFCHNADTWQLIEGSEVSDEVLKKALRYKAYWGKNGGITISGGEPLLQIDFVIDMFEKAKQKGIHTTLDTCGNSFTRDEPFFTKFKALMEVTDLILLDIKHMNTISHKILTGHPNENIIDMAEYLNEIKKPVWIRHVLVPGINDDDASLLALQSFVSSLQNVQRFEILPYHTLGAYKWKELGLTYPLEGVEAPSQELLDHANALLHTEDYKGYLK